LTVAVAGWWAGVDKAWEQEKLAAGKMPEMAVPPTCPLQAVPGRFSSR
jgi:hypothetical protein